jgi:predicted RNase H-like nuclease (RuvC/YqgF family)
MGDDGTKVEEGTHEELLKVPKQVDEDGKPVVGPGLYHPLRDTQQVESAESRESTKKMHKQMQQQQAEMKTQQQRMEEQVQQIEELKFKLNSLISKQLDNKVDKRAAPESKEAKTQSPKS